MGILLTIGFFIIGFGALHGTFAVIGKVGQTGHVRASLLLLLVDAVAGATAPLFDLWLWFVIQALLTVVWFLYTDKDRFVVGGLLGPSRAPGWRGCQHRFALAESSCSLLDATRVTSEPGYLWRAGSVHGHRFRRDYCH